MSVDFLILGTGIQGSIVAKDLMKSGFSVLMCDKRNIKGVVKLDVRNTAKLAHIIKKTSPSAVINCVEADWNLHILKTCINAGVNSIDLGSKAGMTARQLAMNNTLRKRKIIHITGCGSVPGIGNIMLRHIAPDFSRIDSIEAGYAWNSNTKEFILPFSTQTLVEEFTEHADILSNGRFMKIAPMESVKTGSFRFVGQQKYFLVRHAETYTFYHYFKHVGLKNVRFYAGFPEYSFNMTRSLIKAGLGSKKSMIIDGKQIKPIELLDAVLRKLPVPKNYIEKENLWLNVHGTAEDEEKNAYMECLVSPLRGWEKAGSNIDTGMTASIIAQMIKDKSINEFGSFSPEACVPSAQFLKSLKRKGFQFLKNGRSLRI